MPDSVWKITAPIDRSYPKLEGNEQVESVVIGGGFCGLSASLHLAEAGHSVALLESHEPGWGASGRNGGQVIPGLKVDPDELNKWYGSDRGEALAELAGKAPDLVFELIRRYKIECDVRRTGWIQLAVGPKGLGEIKDRVGQWQRRGVDIEALDQDKVHALTGANGYVGGLIDRRGGNLNPLAYTRGLAKAAASAKVKIYVHSKAISVQQIKGKWVVRTYHGKVTASKLLLCTNAYTDGIWPNLQKTIVPFVSGAIATQPLPDKIRKSILKDGQAVADNSRLLSWFGLDRDGRLIFGGRTGAWSESNKPSDYQNRIERMHDVFPQVKSIPVQCYWSGKVALTVDYLPHIHRLAANLYTGLGFNGRGVAMATLMGKLLAACIEHDKNETAFPLSDLKPLPLHAVRKPIVQSVVYWKQLMDRLNP